MKHVLKNVIRSGSGHDAMEKVIAVNDAYLADLK